MALIDLLSYPVHTSDELRLMLGGVKPLAMFSDEISVLPNEDFMPDEAFAPHVADGTFLRIEFVVAGPFIEKLGRAASWVYVLYATPPESWRMEAMKLLILQHARTGEWNLTCERVQGSLLGYSEAQNDEWCSVAFGPPDTGDGADPQ